MHRVLRLAFVNFLTFRAMRLFVCYTSFQMKKVGRVTHYYGKLGVAIVELSDTLKVGDLIRIENGRTSIEQIVSSMQVDHRPVLEARPKDVVGIETGEKVGVGAVVFALG